MKRIAMLLLAAILFAGGDVRAQGLEEMTPQQVQDELYAMQWQYGPGSFALPHSGSTIEIGQDQEILIGEEAARYDYLTGGIESPETEAIVWNAADDSMTYITYYDVGYVTEEDWDAVDPIDFMQQIKEAEVQLNAEREQVGIAPFFTDGWRQEPVFDAPAHTAYWATDLSSGSERWINATALRLSRNGYHQIIWAGSSEGFAAAQATLGGLLDTHRYDQGSRYEDHQDGDPSSDMSIGSLAAATMGVDLGAVGIAGLIGAAILFLKKGWIVIIPVVAGVAALMRRRNRKAPTATGTPSDTPPPPAIT
jgi:uncharacterized membrane-anchored protein